TQLITSNFSFSHSWDWGGSFSLSYARSQDIVTDEILNETLPQISFSLPNITPFASRGSDQGIFDNLSLGYSMTATRESSRTGPLEGGGFANEDTRMGVTHRPRISLNPKLGYF